jgi:hypothetical protein
MACNLKAKETARGKGQGRGMEGVQLAENASTAPGKWLDAGFCHDPELIRISR